MKKIISMLSIVAITSCSFAGTPPEAVTKAFQQKFPTVTNVRWGKENATEWEAEFKMNETKMSANFLTDGSWVETEGEIPVAQIPQIVVAAIKKEYPTWEIKGGDKIETAKKGILYEADLKSGMRKKEVEFK